MLTSAAEETASKNRQQPDCFTFVCTYPSLACGQRGQLQRPWLLHSVINDEILQAPYRERQDVTGSGMEVEWEEDADYLPQVPVC